MVQNNSLSAVALAIALSNQGGGGDSVSDYADLSTKPQIEGVELFGNLSHEDLKVVGRDEFAETEDLIGTELVLETTAQTIIGAINEHEGDIRGADQLIQGLQAEVNHIHIDNEEQVSQYFTTDFEQFLFQNNNYFLDGEVSYNVPQPQEVYVKLDFSKVVPVNEDVLANNHIFGVYKSDYTRVLGLYCTLGSDDEHIKITMLQGGYTIEREIVPTDVVGIVSGGGYHKLYINGTLIEAIPNSAKAEKFVLGNANSSTSFVEGSAISYKAYAIEREAEQEKVFFAEPIDVIEDVTFVDKDGTVKKYFFPTPDLSNYVTDTELSATTRQKVTFNDGATLNLKGNRDYYGENIETLTISSLENSHLPTSIVFTTSATEPTLTITPTIKWLANDPIMISANNTYKITLQYDLGEWHLFS